ncbi:MAG TPA: hypothetical protein VHG08_11130 [Longimicrobium sp.]|nr:hypothetical protein [Longimicrobium sp.]
MRIAHPFAIVLAGALLAAPAGAQNAVDLRPEQRVRIVAPAAGITQPTVGTVVEMRGDTALLQMTASQVAVPVADITSIEWSRGTSRLGGALIGGVIGGGVGYVAAGARTEVARSNRRELGSDTRLLFAGAGAAAGVFLGSLIGEERWRRVPVYAGAAPGGSGGELALRLRF